jgi:predicted nuclease of predicted toxin-antitoxin system
MARIILDECMSPRLVSPLWVEGHDVIHVRNRGLNGAADHTIWRAAVDEDRTVCTINGKDFKKLAAATGLHPGVIVIPGGHAPSAQFNLTMMALTWVSTSNASTGLMNRYIEVGDHGGIVLTEIVYNEKDWG